MGGAGTTESWSKEASDRMLDSQRPRDVYTNNHAVINRDRNRDTIRDISRQRAGKKMGSE